MTESTELDSDWSLIKKYLSNRAFIDPFLFNAVRGRGLLGVVNDLGPDTPEALATAYGRLLKLGKVYGEEEIDEIAHHMEAIKTIQQQLATTEPSAAGELITLAGRLIDHARATADYFRGK
jgi:hypothetical protein